MRNSKLPTPTGAVPPKSLDAALAHVADGGSLMITTYTHVTVINQRTITAWDEAGRPLLSEEGDGYRMRLGRSSVYLLPGQLQYAS